MTFFDDIWSHKETKSFVNKHGYDALMDSLNMEYKYDFYSCSTFWEHDSKYIMKLKGAKGDVVIGWEGIHDNSV